MHHVVMFSGGAGSYNAAKRVIEKEGAENVTLLFADTKIEDEDLYRFLRKAAEVLGAHLEIIADGRTPWEVFFDERFMGNTRVDLCSRILKRDLMDKWVESNFKPDEVVCYVGVDWTEVHRFERLEPRKLPYVYKAPMCEKPYMDKDQMLEVLKADGIEVPRLYGMGFPHNNCGGFCVKAGQGAFKLLLEKMPERYAEHEAKEEEFRQFIGQDVAILRDRRKSVRRESIGVDPEDSSRDDEIPAAVPLTMKELRERVHCGGPVDEFDLGGCGCAID